MPLIDAYGDSTVTQTGPFTQDMSVTFFLRFFDIHGDVYDPSDINVYILDPSDSIEKTYTGVTKIDTGEYAFDYDIAADATTGVWTLRYTFVTDTTSGSETRTIEDSFIVIETGGSTSADLPSYAQAQRTLIRGGLERLLGYFQKMPVYAEQVVFDRDRRRGKLTFGNWNQPAGVNVRRNNNLMGSGYEVDYLKGEILLDIAAESTDVIDIDYNFKWLDGDTIENFVRSGVGRVNSYPPISAYAVGNIPERFIAPVTWGATVEAIRSIIMDLLHQQPQIVFGGPDGAHKALDYLDGLKKNYEEDLKTLLELKKFGPYTNLMSTIIVPEYTLPGGRSRWFRYLFKA